MSVKVKDIMKIMGEFAPLKFAESWDNCGLLVGDKEQTVNKILIALDPTMDVINMAIKEDVDMMITHHPYGLKKFNKVNTSSLEGRKIIQLIKNDIALYSSHTNFDIMGYLNDELARQLGLIDLQILDLVSKDNVYKVVVYVPIEYKETVRYAMCEAGAGYIGNYSDCTFMTNGIGTFMAREGANPAIGEINQLENVEEVRIDTIATKDNLKQIIEAMLKAHPYEEVAYDIYKTEQSSHPIGNGKLGTLAKSTTLQEYASLIKKTLNLDYIHIVGERNQVIKKVAICSGSGMDFMIDAMESGADVLVTGDIKYHDAVYAKEVGLALIDATHFATENIVKGLINEMLGEVLDVEIILDLALTNPIEII